MSNYEAIAGVGETLIKLLRKKMGMDSEIVLCSPGEIEPNDGVRLTLFLYQVVENAHLRNQEMQIANPDTFTPPPLTLELHYMLTAHAASGAQDKTDKSLDEYTVLGHAVQILYDNSVLRGSVLEGKLDKDEQMRINITTLTLEELTQIWSTFANKPFKPSVCYIVTPVKIDSDRKIGTQRVVSKEINYDYKMSKKGDI